jgi:pimeloyl-ACP methyl ester carboxylesterase
MVSPAAAPPLWCLNLRSAAAFMGHAVGFGFGFMPSAHQPKRAKDIHTVVFVHGLAANRAGFFPLQGYLSWAGFKRQYAYNHNSCGSIEGLAVDLKTRLDREVRGGGITLIAHSLGGLVCRAYLQMMGGDRRVDNLITVATPHYGSHVASWLPTTLGAQLRPDGPFLRKLNTLPPPRDVRCLSLVAGKDQIVLPPRHAAAPFGEEMVLPHHGHLDAMVSRRLFVKTHGILTDTVQAQARSNRPQLAVR